MKSFVKDPQAISKLSPEQFRVTQQSHTERPGSGAYLGNKEPCSPLRISLIPVQAGRASLSPSTLQTSDNYLTILTV